MYFDFRFSDGKLLYGQFEWVGLRYACDNNVTVVEKTYAGKRPNRARISNKPARLKDSFQPGFQHSIGEYCDSYSQYKRICKERGFTEVGNEKMTPLVRTETNSYFTDDTLKEFKEMGAEFSDNEAEALKQTEITGDLLHE